MVPPVQPDRPPRTRTLLRDPLRWAAPGLILVSLLLVLVLARCAGARGEDLTRPAGPAPSPPVPSADHLHPARP